MEEVRMKQKDFGFDMQSPSTAFPPAPSEPRERTAMGRGVSHVLPSWLTLSVLVRVQDRAAGRAQWPC